ncbi:MAG: hypothetical protein EBR82_12000 [Caulobacteraceae bacterium]|nr:hypothetical protein [Caulobacteraceae bacterium]
MNLDSLSYVKFGDVDGLGEFLFENGMQHQLFHDILAEKGVYSPKFPLIDADPSNLDDWLFVHNQEHQAIASALGLDNPFDLLDSDWNVEDDFYDWLSIHLNIHQQIISALGISNG